MRTNKIKWKTTLLALLVAVSFVAILTEDTSANTNTIKLNFQEIERKIRSQSDAIRLIEIQDRKIDVNMDTAEENLSHLWEQIVEMNLALEGYYNNRATLEAAYQVVSEEIKHLEPGTPEYVMKQAELTMVRESLAMIRMAIDRMEETRGNLRDMAFQVELGVFQARRAKENMKIQKELQVQKLKYNVESLYFIYLNLKEQIAVQEKNIELMERVYQVDERRYRQGMITSRELEMSEIRLERQKVFIETMKNSQKMILDNIKVLTGYSLDTSIELENIEEVAIEELDLSRAVEMATTSGFDVILKQKEYDGKVEELEFYEHRLGKDSDEYKLALIDIQEAEVGLQQAKERSEQKVRETFRQVEMALKTHLLSQKSCQLAEENLELAGKRYDSGTISELDFYRVQLEFKAAQQEYFQTQLEYLKALKAFKLAQKGIL